MNNYNEKLIEIVKQKEATDKFLLFLEILVCVISLLFLLILSLIELFIELPNLVRVLLMILGLSAFFVCVACSIKIEQIAGYYECAKCGHKYVPTYSSVLWSAHIARTRYMKCPHCNKKSWQKKVIIKE